MIDEAIRRLELALARAGVRGRTRRRLLVEARDHLLEAAVTNGVEEAVRRFGEPDEVAGRLAAELATERTRNAAYGGFAALSAAAAVYLVATGLIGRAGGWPDIASGESTALGVAAALSLVFSPQIAFVAGCLALLRAVRVRRERALPAEELGLLRRRTAVALAAGAATTGSLALWAIEFGSELASWWAPTSLALCAALAVPLGAAAVATARSTRLLAPAGGTAGDVFYDLAPVLERVEPLRRLGLPGHPWRFALLVAGTVGLASFAVGWVGEGTPGDGLVRGIAEAAAVLVCFALLGRALGLRR